LNTKNKQKGIVDCKVLGINRRTFPKLISVIEEYKKKSLFIMEQTFLPTNGINVWEKY